MSADAHTTPDTTNLVALRPHNAAPQSGPAPLLTPPKQAAFCKALANRGNVRLACRAVQVSPQTAYRARRASPAFRQCWDAALVIARDHAEQVLADRALNGVEETVFYHGEEVATRRRYDSRLLLAHLARLDKRAEVQEACRHCGEATLGEHDFDNALHTLESGEGEGAVSLSGLCSMCSTLAADQVEEDAPLPDLAQRLRAMHAAMPEDAQTMSGMDDAAWRSNEAERLVAFETGLPEWWCAVEGPSVWDRDAGD